MSQFLVDQYNRLDGAEKVTFKHTGLLRDEIGRAIAKYVECDELKAELDALKQAVRELFTSPILAEHKETIFWYRDKLKDGELADKYRITRSMCEALAKALEGK